MSIKAINGFERQAGVSHAGLCHMWLWSVSCDLSLKWSLAADHPVLDVMFSASIATNPVNQCELAEFAEAKCCSYLGLGIWTNL